VSRPCTFPWNKKQLMRLREVGMGTPTIAKLYGCDVSTVRHTLLKYGLPTQRIAKPGLSDEAVERFAQAFLATRHCAPYPQD
jgi:hypothetical protein